MHRRRFLGTGLAGVFGASAMGSWGLVSGESAAPTEVPMLPVGLTSPLETRLHVKPVMTNLIHTCVWEGPCRWRAVSVEEERANAESSFARWSEHLPRTALGRSPDVRLLEPAHLKFSEDFVLKPEEMAKLGPDREKTDAFFVYPSGSSIAAFEIAKWAGKPILLQGLGCRNVDIAAYTQSQGQEAFVAADDQEMLALAALLRARKEFRQTRVLLPTDRGLPAACSVGSIADLEALRRELGVEVKLVSYRELAEEMARVLADPALTREAEQRADLLLRQADKAFLDRQYVVRSCQFLQAVANLMRQHACNAFTIECFEFCSSRLPQQWTITPCLIHALLRNRSHASSCEADLGSLLAMRMLMSVARKSCHQGNSDPHAEDTFRINHSAPSMKMNGFDQPDLPFQLGRFVSQGWGTKVVIDFRNNTEKTVTVARVDPTGRRVLVLRGELAGASGWGEDLIGCSVEAVIRPPAGRNLELLKKRLQYGNHLQWVYGDYVEPMRQLAEMLNLQAEIIA